MKYISIFTDDAVSNNQLQGNRKGGIGVFFGASFNKVKSFMVSHKAKPVHKEPVEPQGKACS